MVKFAALSDLHLGHNLYNNSKLQDIHNNIFISIIDSIIDNNCDFVVIAGDLFDKIIPDVETIQLVISQFNKLVDKNIKIYCIEGNHDCSPVNHKHSFLNLLPVKIITDNTINGVYFHDENICIYGINWTNKNLDKLIEDIYPNTSKYNILLLHGSLVDQTNGFYNSSTLSPETINRIGVYFDFVLLGHIHKKFNKNNIYVTGGINILNFGEISEKGYYIVNIIDEDNHNVEYIQTNYTKYKVVDDINLINDDNIVYKLNTKTDIINKEDLKYLHLIVNKIKDSKIVYKPLKYEFRNIEHEIIKKYMSEYYEYILQLIYEDVL